MRDLFPGWVPPDEETLDHYWQEATFAVDASVLLDLYRFSEEAREGLLRALRSFEERLWIPHQVGLEFHRNRLGVLLAQREAESNLLRELDQIREDLDKQLSQLLRGAGRRDLAPLREAIDGGFDSLREKLKEAEKEHTKGLGESIRDDPIYDEVVGLCVDRIGSPFDADRHAAVIRDAEQRFQTKTPPGYLDEGKDEETKYGDVILWHQLCERASETRKPVVLIADDQKTDWVWEVRGKTIGPRPELVAEMSERAGVGFHLYTPTRFLQVWEQREGGRQVGPEILAEIEGSTQPADTREGSLLYLDSLEKQEQGWAISLLNQLFGLRPRAYHFFERNSVMLALEFPPNQVPHGLPLVVVRDPSGKSVSATPAASNAGLPNSGTIFSVRYPGDFAAENLMPGTYEVRWEALSIRKGSEGEGNAATQITTDSFTVPVGSSDG